MTTRDTVLAYFKAIEAMDLPAVAALLDPELVGIEHPNKLNPSGKRYTYAETNAAGERGKAIMAKQSYAVKTLIVEGNRAAAATEWIGTLHDGREMRAQICSVITVRDGKIVRQEQFDCFEP